jgi:hypothetical protein
VLRRCWCDRSGDQEDDSGNGLWRGGQPGRWHRVVFVSTRLQAREQAVHGRSEDRTRLRITRCLLRTFPARH